jgi:hypothetical protein
VNPIRSGLPGQSIGRILAAMGTKSRESIYGSSIRASAQRAKEARQEADRLACEAWNQRMLGYKGPAQPSPALGDALNAGCLYLEVRCLGCDTHQTVALVFPDFPALAIWMACSDLSGVTRLRFPCQTLIVIHRRTFLRRSFLCEMSPQCGCQRCV